MESRELSVHALMECSEANGPGKRFVVWVRGCSLQCPGCFNAETHGFGGGQRWSVSELVEYVERCAEKYGLEGVTISGGEPLQQAGAVMEFARRIKQETGLSVVMFSGFEWDEIKKMPVIAEICRAVDVVIAGRYRQELRIAEGLQGSQNKQFKFLSQRYRDEDFRELAEAEIVIDAVGGVMATGIDPMKMVLERTIFERKA